MVNVASHGFHVHLLPGSNDHLSSKFLELEGHVYPHSPTLISCHGACDHTVLIGVLGACHMVSTYEA